MKLHRLRVAELRQFRAPFELADLQPGLNLFTGPNEAGKSTLVRAIRAAFFERHRSTSVDDLRPWGDASAAPSVELDFELGGTEWRLTKSFLHRKRCELRSADGRRLEGVEAEDFLAEALGFRFAGKGASKPGDWGIPGLLWIEQGSAQSLREPVEVASDHLRSALEASVGEVASGGHEALVATVRAARDELLTPKGGQPRGAYQQAIAEADAGAEKVAALQRAVEAYRSEVDTLKALRDAHAADAAEQPWRGLRERLASAQQALAEVQALAGQRDRERESLRQLAGLRGLLQERLAAHEAQQQALVAREAALARAEQQREQAHTDEARARAVADAAARQRAEAADALTLARQEDNRRTLAREAAAARDRAEALAATLASATEQHTRLLALQREAAALAIDAKDLATLRRQAGDLQELRIRQAAIATRVQFALQPDRSLHLGDETLIGQGERLLLAETTLEIEGIGRLRITPGGRDLGELAARERQLAGEHAALLQRLGLDTLDQVESRDRQHAQRLGEAQAAGAAAQLLAPRGLDPLRQELDALRARAAEAAAALARLPAEPAVPVAALDAAQRAFDAARAAAEQAQQQHQAARQAQAVAAGRCEAERRERDALRAALSDPALLQDLAERRATLVDQATRETALAATLAAIEARIQAARPDILQQDVERLRRSADEAERQHQARDRQIAQLEATLAAAGAQGLEEELAGAQAAALQAARRRDELRRRAEALAYLLDKLEARQRALTQRLQAPLQKHLDHYLSLLFPQARLQVDASLRPTTLLRGGMAGADSGDVDALSFGAREQTGVIARLAYADLLRDAGRPTLLILDDALVHSDEQRLDRMKRVLFDAAQRHQLLLFTCHPAAWRDMGVPLRPLQRP